MKSFFAIFLLLSLTAAAAADSPEERPMLSWSELEARPLPPAGERIVYGKDSSQFGELRVPEGKGPFPVVMLIHGGCWLSDFDYRYMTHLAAALQQQGYASWTIEYRRLGASGGGWPATFVDVGRAADQLRKIAGNHPLNLSRVVAMGHSAGGQLALWLPTRARLPAGSEIAARHPLKIHAVIGLAAITDLRGYRVGPPDSCHASVDPLLGGGPDQQAARYAQTSPIERLPLGVAQRLIQGRRDPIVAIDAVRDYVARASAAGDAAQVLEIPGGHFDTVSPDGEAWVEILQALKSLTAR